MPDLSYKKKERNSIDLLLLSHLMTLSMLVMKASEVGRRWIFWNFLRNYLVLTPNLLDGDKAFWITVFFAGLYHLLTRESCMPPTLPSLWACMRRVGTACALPSIPWAPTPCADESICRSSWESRTCYPWPVTNQGLTDDLWRTGQGRGFFSPPSIRFLYTRWKRMNGG